MSDINRRNFLKISGLTAASAMAAHSGTASAGLFNNKTIDTHHHMLPDVYIDGLASIGITSSGGVPFPTWSPELSLQLMDTFAIDSAVLSLSAPGTYFGEGTESFATNLATQVNEYASEVVSQNPSRFGFFATLPQPLGTESAAEAVYALDTLGADGVCLLGSANDKFLGDPIYDEVLAELDARAATVFLHPNAHSSSFPENLGLEAPMFAFEFMADTTRAVENMIWNGTFERFPNIKWIIAHAGATLPYLAYRLELLDLLDPSLLERSPQGTRAYLSKLNYDTALSASHTQIDGLRNLVDDKQIIFGTDYPFAPAEMTFKSLADLAAMPLTTNVPFRTIRKIKRNGYRLFPRLAELNGVNI